MSNLKYKLEALLFSSARSMNIEELCHLTNASPEEVREKLNELKKDYGQRDSSITLIDEGNAFKLNVKSEHIHVIQQIVTETELSKTLMETLAVIAFKYPIKQSDLIKIRTNKAYDHLRELEEMGYVTRQKYGRTKLIKLTQKFFEYFDLPPEKLKEKFADFGGIAQAIKEKEEEIKQIKEEMKKKAKEAGKKKEGEKEPEIDIIDQEGHKQKLEVYKETEKELEQEEAKEVVQYKEKLGDLEVTDIPEKDESEEPEETKETEGEAEGIPMTEEIGDEVVETIKEEIEGEEPSEEETEQETEEEPTKEPEETTEEEKEEPSEEPEETTEETSEESEDKGEKTPDEVEEEVDRRVEELLHPKEEEEEQKVNKKIRK